MVLFYTLKTKILYFSCLAKLWVNLEEGRPFQLFLIDSHDNLQKRCSRFSKVLSYSSLSSEINRSSIRLRSWKAYSGAPLGFLTDRFKHFVRFYERDLKANELCNLIMYLLLSKQEFWKVVSQGNIWLITYHSKFIASMEPIRPMMTKRLLLNYHPNTFN